MKKVLSQMITTPSRKKLVVAISVLFAAGCSLAPNFSGLSSDSYRSSGMIAVTGQVPSAAHLASSELLAFMPSPENTNRTWLKIVRATGEITLMQGRKSLVNFSSNGAKALPTGRYEIQHKQAEPSWYAPDSYFTNRKLPVPPAFDKSRYLRGALGGQALFLNDEIALHSGAIWSDEVGGLRISEQALNKLFETLPVGSFVEIA